MNETIEILINKRLEEIAGELTALEMEHEELMELLDYECDDEEEITVTEEELKLTPKQQKEVEKLLKKLFK